ncbi:MAG: hypothetical protein CO069_01585 [Gallionellaceae bacterium CG_4_9_14_0_8_um_filter_60_335]|nr:MAG: hypothetical protein AUJ80_04330 [Gallionellaceae bacterium CG1_02_60_325]PIR09534.1 MAG: hypothetical protein COV51_03675 [Gallionellaceae bacterium CG11_big_fil_rev_8_21_14_0_20_60_62]PIV48040.1 MAG: hypothetical protein COS20_01570 [Gallionellaceae bacterium CG02_land_8_20_14_3_00_60_115]PIY06745.1 MAG: hypothetical protein COZ19_00530 [Gallionellaceae bacterium CG_4_10_14_3_um_filter_60_1069]PJC05027.1 MAG: hypothetical protein CO069_01585 [Gallionellaceae bacterium CG_4_9_14_0_8_um
MRKNSPQVLLHCAPQFRFSLKHSDRNRNERLHGKVPGAEKPECTQKYMRIPSTAQRRHATAQ